MDQPGTGELAQAAEALARLTPAALSSIGGTAALAALASLSAVRRLAAGLERSELALIETARDNGATWSQISAALGTRNRQTAQKRHADLARRCPRPPSADIPQEQPAPGPPATGPGSQQPGTGQPEGADDPANDGQLPRQVQLPLAPAAGPRPAPAAAPPQPPARPKRRTPVPEITNEVIAEGLYELARAPDHAETRAWLVLIGGRAAGRIRPTWHGERSRQAWEPVDLSGVPLPVRGTGRVTPAGNARTRDAAAVSLLRALQSQQQEDNKDKRAARRAHPLRTGTHTA